MMRVEEVDGGEPGIKPDEYMCRKENKHAKVCPIIKDAQESIVDGGKRYVRFEGEHIKSQVQSGIGVEDSSDELKGVISKFPTKCRGCIVYNSLTNL